MESRRNQLEWFGDLLGAAFLGPLKGLYFMIDQAWAMFLVALLSFVFRPPGLEGPPFDRIAFVLLILLVVMASLTRRGRLSLKSPIVLPMIGMTIIATVGTLSGPYKTQTWSILANTFIVPYTMFFLAKAVFRDDRVTRYLFAFCALVAAYLIFTAVAFLLGAQFIIFPRYVLTPGVGTSEFLDRACGPFLNPVANGTAIIMLGLVSVHWFLKMKKGFLRILLLSILITLPLGIFATMTRGVWLSGLFAVAFFFVSTKYAKVGKAGTMWLLFAFIGIWMATNSTSIMRLMSERLHDQHNIEFRLDLYRAALDMINEKPILGWGTNVAPFVVNRYLKTYKDDVWLHNTYLDVLVGQGIVGFLLYASIIAYLFGLGRRIPPSDGEKDANMIDREFVLMFRNILCVYLINGMFVIMLYQFTNVFVYALAGIISGKESGLGKRSIVNKS